MVGTGNARKRRISSPWSDSCTMDSKIGLTAPARTLCGRLAANSLLAAKRDRHIRSAKSSRNCCASGWAWVMTCRLKKWILGGKIAFDVDEADNSGGILLSELESRQPAHGMADDVEPIDLTGAKNLHVPRQPRMGWTAQEVGACDSAATGYVIREHWPIKQPRLLRDIGIVLFGRAEAMQEDNGSPVPDRYIPAISTLAESITTESRKGSERFA